MKNKTSWGSVAGEYDAAFTKEGSYHDAVLLPNIVRVMAPQKGARILEVGCGDGFFSRALSESGAEVVGCDVAPEMIDKAKKYSDIVQFEVSDAAKLSFAKDGEFDSVLMALSLQNIENYTEALAEAARVLKNKGSLVVVMNHPVLRIPKRSFWDWDETKKVQYRRLDGYMSESREQIDMDPGKKTNKRYTYSFHRPLQVYVKAFAKAGFAIDSLEEWISHKQSEKGPRSQAEDAARKEFPMFLMLKAHKRA